MGFFSFFNSKERRKKYFTAVIQEMVLSDKKEAVTKSFYFEAAVKFAKENGENVFLSDSQSVSFSLPFNGEGYHVYISRHLDNTVYIGLSYPEDLKKTRDEFRALVSF